MLDRINNLRRPFFATAVLVAYFTTSYALPAGAQPPIDPEGGPPPFDPPPVVLTLTATEVRREIYVAAATGTDRTELDVLAGSTAELASLSPNASASELRTTIAGLWSLLLAQRPSTAYDLTGTPARRASKLLAKGVPLLPAASRPAVSAYARKYAAALREGLDQTRALTRIESLYDQEGNYLAFRKNAWERLFAAAQASPVLAGVLDESGSPFFQTLGVRTSDGPAVMLASRDFEPMKTFVLAHLQGDGSLVAGESDVNGLVNQAGTSAMSLAQSYATTLFDLNRAEETYLASQHPPLQPLAAQSVAAPPPAVGAAEPDPLAVLKAACEAAEKKRKEDDVTWDRIKPGVPGAFSLAASLTKLVSPDASKAITTYGKAASTLIDTLSKYTKGAEEATKILAKLTSAEGLAKVVGGAIFAAGLIGVAVEVFAVLSAGPDPTVQLLQTVLQKLTEIKNLITDVRTEMRGRFDRIDDKLNRILDTMVMYFDLVNWEIGQTQVQVGEVQAGLYELQSDVSRLERNIYTFISTASLEDLQESISGNLGYRQRTGVDMPYQPTFVDAENSFYSWARDKSSNPLHGGPLDRSYTDDALLEQLTTLPLATNINYLSQLPQARFGLAPLSVNRLSNPLVWGVSAESYSQLSEEWPAFAAVINASRLANVQDSGQRLATALNAIASGPLFDRLPQHYQGSFAGLKARIDEYEAAYEADPANRVYGVDLWSGPNQVPSQSFLSQTKDLHKCNGGGIGNVPSLPFTFRQSDYPGYGALMIGDNLFPGALSACVEGVQTVLSAEDLGFGGLWRFTYRLDIVVHISYAGTRVIDHWFWTDKQQTKVKHLSDPDPAWEQPVVDIWSRLRGFFAFLNDLNPGFVNQVRGTVAAGLVSKQRDFYTKVAQQTRLAGNPIARAAGILSGSKKLWESYVSLGLPTALEQSDILRALLFGGSSVFTGNDLGDDDGLLNDVEDVYLFTANQPTPPSQNVMAGLNALQAERANALRDEIARIRQGLQASGEHDGEDLVRSTLVRLSVLPPVPLP